MSIKSKFCLLGLAFATTLPLHAQEVEEIAAPADNMTVVRDKETGKLRAATAQEQLEMQQEAAAAVKGGRVRAAAAPRAKLMSHPSGAQGAKASNAFMSAAVIERKADGKLQKQCYESHDAANTAVQSGHTHVTPTVTPTVTYASE